MADSVHFGTVEWKDKPDKPEDLTQEQWDAKESSGFNGFPFPFVYRSKPLVGFHDETMGTSHTLIELDEDPVEPEIWDGATYYTYSYEHYEEGGTATITVNYQSSKAESLCPVVGPGTPYQEVSLDFLVKLFWRVKRLKFGSGTHFNVSASAGAFGMSASSSISLSSPSEPGTPNSAYSKERYLCTQSYENPQPWIFSESPEYKYILMGSGTTEDSSFLWYTNVEDGLGSFSFVPSGHTASKYISGGLISNTWASATKPFALDVRVTLDGNNKPTYYLNLTGIGYASIYELSGVTFTSYEGEEALESTSQFSIDGYTRNYYYNDPDSVTTILGSIPLTLVGESFLLPFYYKPAFGTVLFPVRDFAIEIEASEYWPYKNSAGDAVFETNTGVQINPIS